MKNDVSAALDAFGDATRRAIIGRLAAGPATVGDIAAGRPVGRPAVSMHLRVLRDAGLVEGQATGSRRVYRLRPEGLVRLREHLDWSQKGIDLGARRTGRGPRLLTIWAQR